MKDEFEDFLKDDIFAAPEVPEPLPPPPTPSLPKFTKDSNPNVDKEVPKVNDGGKVRELKQGERISFRDRLKMGREGDTAWVITMLFGNGTCRQFVITTKSDLFEYKKSWYHLRYENSWFDLTFKYYRLFFFENYVEPLDKEIIRKGDVSWWTVTPDNIRPYVKQQYVKNLTESEFEKWLRIITVLSGITLFAMIGMVGYFIAKGGIPGLGG